MTRAFITLDETNPLKPVPCLHVNGQELRMSEVEMEGLIAELKWIKDCMRNTRAIYYSHLADKYRSE